MIEVRSPDDETYEKFPFFVALGVREVIVVDSATRRPEIHRLAGLQYVAVAPDREGWISSEVLGVRFRLGRSTPPVLQIEDVKDPSIRVET